METIKTIVIAALWAWTGYVIGASVVTLILLGVGDGLKNLFELLYS